MLHQIHFAGPECFPPARVLYGVYLEPGRQTRLDTPVCLGEEERDEASIADQIYCAGLPACFLSKTPFLVTLPR